MMPVNLTERIRAELKKPFYQEKVRVMMRLYQDVLFWQFGDCGPVMGPQKFTMHNQIERLLSTIYKLENLYMSYICIFSYLIKNF